jgi:Ca2+-binding RTX toxin-like protein
MRHLLVPAALVVTILSLPTAAPAYAEAATCHGLTATIEADTGEVMGTSGNDVIVVSGSLTGSVTLLDAGAGDDLICVVGLTGQLSLRSGTGNDTIDASTAGSLIFGFLGPGADSYMGGPQSDQIEASGPDPVVISTAGGDDYVAATGGPATVSMGPGDDVVSYAVPPGRVPSSLELGTGEDWLSVEGLADLRIDLRRHTIRQKGVTTTVHHAEDVVAGGKHVVLRGDGGDNTFKVIGCRVDVYGAGGDDHLSEVADFDLGVGPCHPQRARLYGGPGDDFLRGFAGDDLLVGGPGSDVAVGSRGSDRCLAETRRRCER